MIVATRFRLGSASKILVRSFRSSDLCSSPASEANKGNDVIKRTLSPSSTGQSMPSNVAMKEYGFMESAEILFSEREKPRIIGRWDWHAWQLFVSLLPPFEEEQKEAPRQLEKEQMRTRLEALEELVRNLQEQMDRPETDTRSDTPASTPEAGLGPSNSKSSISPSVSTQPRWLGLQRTQPPEAHSSSGGGGFSTGHGGAGRASAGAASSGALTDADRQAHIRQ
ncbi:hypothetical protein WJX75_008834 [Coccomyxa subellipsoidea]|uniref:Uncharacterized protein n=1 Tax=Coccomyxa subellipsoidea TaxID=248742 RepID=A0ABR2Z2F4_9CHLO